MLKRLLACLLALVCSLGAAAAARSSDVPLDLNALGAPTFTTYSTNDGLPATIMVEVQVDRSGFVWASSANQLARYDGSHWQVIDDAGPVGVLGSPMTTHDGALWIAYRDIGIFRHDKSGWVASAHFPSRHARHVAQTRDAKGRYHLWALTFDRGLLQQVGNRWQPVAGSAALPKTLLSIASTQHLFAQPRLWVGSGDAGLWYRDGDGVWQAFHAPGLDRMQIEDLLVTQEDGREALWISTFGNGLWRLDDRGLKSWRVANSAVASDAFYSLVASELPNGKHAIWAATRNGLVRIINDQARVFDRSYGLPSNAIRDVSLWSSPNGDQVLWLATENGMARALVGGAAWQTVSLFGADANGLFAVLSDTDETGNERLWLGSSNHGLMQYRNGVWHHYDTSNGLPSQSVFLLKHATDTNGKDQLWLGTGDGILARVLPGPRFEPMPVPWRPGRGETVSDVASTRFDGHPALWVATRWAGLKRLRDGHWDTLAPPNAPSRWGVRRLTVQTDANGRTWLWASSALGLLRYDGHQLDVALTPAELGQRELLDMSLFTDNHDSVLWLGSDNGILRVNVSDPRRPAILPDSLPKAPDPVVYGALRNSRGQIYLCTNNGVQVLTPSGSGYNAQVVKRRNGLPHDECNGGAQYVDARDRYWVGMLGGLGVHDPALTRTDRQAKPIAVTAIWIDGDKVPVDNITLHSGKDYLRVRYALLSWIGNDKSRFRTQLLGDEKSPSPWSTQNERSFDHLPPGDYRLRIEARDYAGNPSQPVDLPIRVLPAWWQTGIARGGYALAIAALFWALLQWRLRSLRSQRKVLESQVNARTEELNVANSLLLELSYRDPLTGLANRRKLHDVLEDAAEHMDSTPWSLIFVDVDHFKDYNDAFGHPAGDEALRVVAAAMLACAPTGALAARYGGEEFACLLRATPIHHALEIAECMRRRVQASEITVPGESRRNHATISVGVAEGLIESGTDCHCLLRDADKALYAAKAAGRNCIRP